MITLLLFLMALCIGIMGTFIFELILQTNKRLRDRYYRRHEVLFGFHVHHSTIGLLLVIISGLLLLMHEAVFSLIIFGIGLGIITMHTISSKRFVFIEREDF